MTVHKDFVARAFQIMKDEGKLIGLAVAGSWLTNEIDEYSDIDLILITKEKIGGDKNKMLEYAQRLPHFISGFTGEHVGEPRVLICLYDNPLLHVDIKFVTLDEFRQRIETPVVLLDKGGKIQKVLEQTEPKFPFPDYQWIEDRFWTWVHYALLKIGRGEYLEALDFFGFLRMMVFGPLLHIKNGNLPRAVRKVEMQLPKQDFEQLKATIPTYAKVSLMESLDNSVALYRQLRDELFSNDVTRQSSAETKVMAYSNQLRKESDK